MAFSQKQVRSLVRSVPGRFVRTRVSNGHDISFIEGWYAIAQANRLFGFEGWHRETVDSRCVFSREARGIFQTAYVAKVRVTVRADGQTIVREGCGTGEGKSSSPADAHDVALKGAETDATKRALVTFGKPFGLALYANTHARSNRQNKNESTSLGEPNRLPDGMLREPHRRGPNLLPNGFHGPAAWRKTDDPQTRSEDSGQSEQKFAFPAAAEDEARRSFFKPLNYRRRDRNHLRFVATLPCLVCGRTPSDPHHLRFAQPRALGAKVSDEFTVPLCRAHDRGLHQSGNEPEWWKRASIDPLPTARTLWEARGIGGQGSTIR